MAYSDKISGDIEKDAENIMMLTSSNKNLRQHIDEIYACYQEGSWASVAKALPESDRFFGTYFLIIDDCVNEYLTDYNVLWDYLSIWGLFYIKLAIINEIHTS